MPRAHRRGGDTRGRKTGQGVGFGIGGEHKPSGPEMSSLSLSSWSMSSSEDRLDMKSSSESMALEAEVKGVGGAAASGPAEANRFGILSLLDIVASAAFRLRVVGGIVEEVEPRRCRRRVS